MSFDPDSEPRTGIAPPTSLPTPERAISVRTFLFAMATDAGPKLLAFRTSNLLFGRLPDNHLAINHGSVSRRHARLSVTAKGVFIEDMQSQNGTTINGVKVQGQAPLRPGDVLRIGHVALFYFGFINPDQPPVSELVESATMVTPLVSSPI